MNDSIDTPAMDVPRPTDLRNRESPNIDPTIAELKERIKQLEAEVAGLRKASSASSQRELTTRQPPVFQILNRVEGVQTSFLGWPSWDTILENTGQPLKISGNRPVESRRTLLQRRGNVAFLIERWFDVENMPNLKAVHEAIKAGSHLPAPMPTETSVTLISGEMKNTFTAFNDAAKRQFGDFPDLNLDLKENLRSPYQFWFHCRQTSIIDGLPSVEKELMKLLTDWIDESYREEYSETESLFQRGIVTDSTFPGLIAPGELFIFKEKSHDRAYKAKSWPHYSDEHRQWRIDAWTYRYDGKFWNVSEELELCEPDSDGVDDAEIAIGSLFGVPLRFETHERKLELKERGRTYWKCRRQHLVSYQSQETDEKLRTLDARYMVDFAAYKGLYSNRPGIKDEHLKIEPGDFEVFDITRDDGGPKGDELMLFPPKIKGFDMRGKVWRDLDVDCIREVQWRKEAFDHLVVDEDIKDLIQALVTNKIATNKSTDWIGSKGNGFTMLLHGGPGTGKTFTAESVAELAQKPLYAITCGDIGTKPEAVEKYLQSNLSLGKRWDCVVLLDEADVFLEQRTLNDLDRNALVSVFLRVLEYYEGIMVLTSNRVGIFDEAFKSRIQLALRYDNLGKAERTKVWRNFFSRLRLIGEENIDYDTVDSYIEELAEYKMNGRQIRNAITTARQLAQFKKKPMTWGHLRHVIKVAEKFDNYLKGVHEEMSDDVIARGEGIR